jgi:hypothetical protein
VAIVVAGRPAVRGESRKTAFDDPAARIDGEATLVGGFTHDLDGGPERVTGPVDDRPAKP